MQKNLGVALDIGTTTIQARLIDLDSKDALSYFSCLNEQLAFGHDVISRIRLCLDKPDGLERLRKRAISSINFVIENLISISKEDKKDISLIGAVGNTAIYHFVLGLSPERLAKAPYEPAHKAAVKKKAEALGIEAGRDCEFCFLPNIGGFVGSDAIGVILASGIDKSESPLLAVDIGTNGEIIVGSKERIWAASTSAGPAFEGWHVSCGIRAVEGAIERIEDRGGELSLRVIGGGEPKGIAGSGLIDIIAILLDRGHIDRAGTMKEDFIIFDNHKKISLSKRDVRELQLAKAAFSTGIAFLRRLPRRDFEKFFITGKFGGYINKDSARKTGLIPHDVAPERVEFLENGALRGAEIFITDRGPATSRIEEILKKTEHVPLSRQKDFQREFIESMRF